MTAFEFDRGSTPGTNRSAAITDCATCNGDRLVPTDPDDPHGAYMRCPACNALALHDRAPVPAKAWWKE